MVVGIVRLYRSPLAEDLFIAQITQKLKEIIMECFFTKGKCMLSKSHLKT